MKDTKIIDLLKNFSNEEMKEFGYFVHSPYYNRIKNVSKLFDQIKKFHPEFSSRYLNNEYLFKRVTGKIAYNDGVMRNLYSDLYSLGAEYLGNKSFSGKPHYKKMLQLCALRKLNEGKNLEAELEKLRETLERSKHIDEDHYFDLFQYWNLRNNSFDARSVEKFHQNINNEIGHLSQYFIIHLFDRFFQANRFRTSYKTNAKHNFLSDTAAVLKKYGYMESAVAKIYFKIYMLTMTFDETCYFQLKDLLKDNFKNLSSYIRYIIFQSLTVYFMNTERRGIKKFRKDRFELYRDYAKSGDIIYNNVFSDASYTNGVVAGINAGEFEWAEKFNEDFKKYLPLNIRQDAYYYNKSRMLHSIGKNEEALGFLSKVISTHHPIKAVVKVVELQILYELDMVDSIYLKLDSFRHFFTKNPEMSDTMRANLKNFFKTYNMLLETKLGSAKYPPEIIRKELTLKKQSYSMDWLKEKTDELEKKVR